MASMGQQLVAAYSLACFFYKLLAQHMLLSSCDAGKANSTPNVHIAFVVGFPVPCLTSVAF